MLVNTSLRSLADNIDGCSWPVDDPDETPARFIDLTRSDAIARLAEEDLPPAKLDLLANILRGTLAFDSSLGDMLEISHQAEPESNLVLRNLDRLGIPRDFPVRLCNFTPDMHRICLRERVATIHDFINLGRGEANLETAADDIRRLLNAFSHIDEQVVARFLPYRIKTCGLYLIEAIGHVARALPAEERERLVREPASITPELRARLAAYANHFAEQTTRIRSAHAGGTRLDRLVAPLDDLSIEPTAAALLGQVLNPTKPSPPPPPPPPPAPLPTAPLPKSGGFIGRLKNILGV